MDNRPSIPDAPSALSVSEQALLDAIAATGAPEARALCALLKDCWKTTSDPLQRDAISARYAAALAARHQADALPLALGLETLRSGLDRTAWETLSRALPGVAAVAALVQLAGNGGWRRISTALPALATTLPPLRSHAQLDQMIRALPEALHDSLAVLHAWVRDADATLVPTLRVSPLAAIAVAALLWQVQRALPAPRAALPGIAGWIVTLPHCWQRLAGLNRVAGALLAPVQRAPMPRLLTHVRAGGPGIVPAPPHPPQPVSTSAASRPGDHALMSLAGGMVVSGLAMIRQGWRYLHTVATDPADAAPDPGGDEAGAIAPVITLLDDIVDVDGGGTIWEDLYARVHAAADTDPQALAALVQDRLLANDVAEAVLVHLPDVAEETPVATAEGHRVRRSPVIDHVPDVRGRGSRVELGTATREQLNVTSHRLAVAVQALPSAPLHPEDVLVGSQAGIDLPMARLQLRRWMTHTANTTAVDQQKALARALQDLAYSDARLLQVDAWVPRLDASIEADLTQHLRQVTNHTVPPSAIYLNTYTRYPAWPAWEASLPAPDPRLFELYRRFPNTTRIRSGRVSSYSLVEAAVNPPRTGPASALYYRGDADAGFPAEECNLVTLAQFNQANANRTDTYAPIFRQRLDAFIASSRAGSAPERDAYVDAMRRRLRGTATLLTASGQLDAASGWLLKTLEEHPTRFGAGNDTLGRALALPGQDIRVNAVLAAPASGGEVALHGMLLLESLPSPERPQGAVVVLCPTRSPLLQSFPSRGEALRQIREEVRGQLHRWVATHAHRHWGAGSVPVKVGAAIDDDLLQALFYQQLPLRSEQLHHPGNAPAAELRRDYVGLEQRLRTLPLPVALPTLEAAHECAAAALPQSYDLAGAHWLAHAGLPSRGVLRNPGVAGAQWLKRLKDIRSDIEHDFPLPLRFAAGVLEQAVLNQTGVAIDTRAHYLVRFSGGTPSQEAASGFVHTAPQKVGSCLMVECAFDKAEDYPDGDVGSHELGLYASDNSTLFDAETEVDGLLPGQFITAVRSLDLRSDYRTAVEAFWAQHRSAVKTSLRGIYLFAAWQQYAEGSLSEGGLQRVLAATGYMVAHQAEDLEFECHAADGTRISWVSLYGTRSTLLRIDHAQRPEVVLYAPGDATPFREFSDAAQLSGWLTRVATSEDGRRWLESAFDLAELQDGWFSNGVDTTLGKAHGDLFQGNRSALAIDGDDLFEALATRQQARTLRDGDTLFASNWEVWRSMALRRLNVFNAVVGIGSLVLPPLLPVVEVGSFVQLGLGLQESIYGRTDEERHDGAVDASWGAFGLVLSVPFGMVRFGALCGGEGLRVEPAVQAAVETLELDPLRTLSARYAQPESVVVDGARPADNGIHHYLDRHFIRQSGNVYEVTFDDVNRTWRLKSPNTANQYLNPVRLNAEGVWEPHTDVGLAGGGRGSDSAIERTNFMYRGALNSHVERMRSTQSLDSISSDFRWGMSHWQRVVLPEEIRRLNSLQGLKELFVKGPLDPIQRGALAVVIAKVEQTMQLEHDLRVEQAVQLAVDAHGGYVYPLSTTLLEPAGRPALDAGSRQTMGWCTGISRLMATAIPGGEQAAMIKNLRVAMRRPGEGMGAEVMAHIRDAQGVALPAGTVSAAAPIEYGDVGRFLGGSRKNAQFFLTGSRHHMLVAVNVQPNGSKVFELLDSNLGFMRFYTQSQFDSCVRYLFGSRYFSAMPWSTRQIGRETLAEMYGATRATEQSSASQFMIRQVDPEKLRALGRRRGWDRLLEDIPAR